MSANIELWLSFITTWATILIPPVIIRFVRRKPLSKWAAAIFMIISYFINTTFFIAMGSKNRTHMVLVVGAIVCFYVLRWQTKSSAKRNADEQRKVFGYDD